MNDSVVLLIEFGISSQVGLEDDEFFGILILGFILFVVDFHPVSELLFLGNPCAGKRRDNEKRKNE